MAVQSRRVPHGSSTHCSQRQRFMLLQTDPMSFVTPRSALRGSSIMQATTYTFVTVFIRISNTSSSRRTPSIGMGLKPASYLAAADAKPRAPKVEDLPASMFVCVGVVPVRRSRQ
jgi:hypothetical protein